MCARSEYKILWYRTTELLRNYEGTNNADPEVHLALLKEKRSQFQENELQLEFDDTNNQLSQQAC